MRVERGTTDVKVETEKLNNLSTSLTKEIDRTVDTKVKIAFTEAIGSPKMKSIVSNANVDIMKDDD